MFVTWTALHLDEPAQTCPWVPPRAHFAQAGQAGAGRAEMPSFEGRWWSVLSTWRDADLEAATARPDVAGSAWHVVLRPAAFRGDAVLSGGARPFDELPTAGRTAGASAVITMAGLGPDPDRTTEFFERFTRLGHDVAEAPGNRAALIQAPEDGAVLTFAAWQSLRDAVTWAYHRPEHAAAVRRNEDHVLIPTSGFLRCAVLASSGTLGDRADPLAGLTGTVTLKEPA